MAEQRQITFSHREVAEALINHYGLDEGFWGLYIEFGIGAANIATDPANPDNLVPAAFVPIQKIGIQRFDKPNSLTADASLSRIKEQKPRERKAKASAKK